MKVAAPILVALFIIQLVVFFFWFTSPKQDQPIDILSEKIIQKKMDSLRIGQQEKMDSLNILLAHALEGNDKLKDKNHDLLAKNWMLQKKLIRINYAKQHLDSLAVHFKYTQRQSEY